VTQGNDKDTTVVSENVAVEEDVKTSADKSASSVNKTSNKPVISKSEKRRRAKEAAIAASEERKAQEALMADEANMTKRARRRAKEAAEAEAASASANKKSAPKTISSEQYNAMKTKRAASSAKKKRAPNQRKGVEEKRNPWQRFRAWLRAIKAELKAITWPPFRSTSKVTGVWSNIGTVVLVVLFFMVVITAFDFGLTAALRELVGIGNK
jgi:preprotein translocase subunit SecE